MDDRSSGLLGIAGLAGFVVLFIVLHSVFPSIAKMMLIAVGVIVLLVLVLVAVVLYFAFQKPEGKPGSKESEEADAILKKGRSNLMELRRLSMQVRNSEIRQCSGELCGTVDKILRTLKEQPQDIPRVRQFFQYYLPTLGNILLKYVRIEAGEIPADDTTAKTISGLKQIQTAMEKQYASLFEDDILDLSVDIEALQLACKRDGLLTDERLTL